jgi:hypothetical protein
VSGEVSFIVKENARDEMPVPKVENGKACVSGSTVFDARDLQKSA